MVESEDETLANGLPVTPAEASALEGAGYETVEDLRGVETYQLAHNVGWTHQEAREVLEHVEDVTPDDDARSIEDVFENSIDVHDAMRSRPLWERLPPRKLTAREIAATLPDEAAPEGGKVCAYGYVVPGERLDGSPFVAFVVRARSFHHLHCSGRDGWKRVETDRGEGLGYGTSREVLAHAADLLDADAEMIAEIATADPHGNDAAFDETRRVARRREDSGPNCEFDELPEADALKLADSLYKECVRSETVDEDELKEPVDTLEREVEQAKEDADRLHRTLTWTCGPGLKSMVVDEDDSPDVDAVEGVESVGVEVDYDVTNDEAILKLSTFGVRTSDDRTTTASWAALDDARDEVEFDVYMRRKGDDLVAGVRDPNGHPVTLAKLEDVFEGDGDGDVYEAIRKIGEELEDSVGVGGPADSRSLQESVESVPLENLRASIEGVSFENRAVADPPTPNVGVETGGMPDVSADHELTEQAVVKLSNGSTVELERCEFDALRAHLGK